MSPPARSAAERLHRHSLTRVMVLPELKVLFLPVPKSGCTSMLWTLADLAGLSRDRFTGSRAAEVSRSMAIHDTALWEPEHRWESYSSSEQQAILDDDSWLRFSLVRDPAPRLWSAWQSKLLLAEPRFVARFADEPWFPGPVDSVAEAVTAFRAFVAALDVPLDEAPHDAHWGPQHLLTDGFALNWVGRAENPTAALDRLAEHLATVGSPRVPDRDVPRENAAPLPFTPAVYDEASLAVLHRVYGTDLAQWDYAALTPSDVAGEPTEDPAGVRLVNELAERHRRIGELLAALQEEQQQTRTTRRTLDRARTRARRAESDLAAVHASTSWRVTRPLRALRARTGAARQPAPAGAGHDETVQRAVDRAVAKHGVDRGFAETIAGIAGPISLRQADLLRSLAAEVSDGVIIEVGSFRGRSTAALALGAAQGHRAPVYAIEPHEEFTGPVGGEFGAGDRREFYRSMLQSGAWENVRLVTLSSEVAAAGWDTSVGLLWLDGDHRYEAARRDFEAWQPYLLQSAPVVLDDTDRGGPHQLVDELLQQGWQRVRRVHEVTVLCRTG